MQLHREAEYQYIHYFDRTSLFEMIPEDSFGMTPSRMTLKTGSSQLDLFQLNHFQLKQS
jgi:hypothetical protein